MKDKNGDMSSLDIYRGLTVSPVISNIFEGCLLVKFQQLLLSNELQLCFKKNIGCGPATYLTLTQQVVNYFTSKKIVMCL
jgi:hypothetical protein